MNDLDYRIVKNLWMKWRDCRAKMDTSGMSDYLDAIDTVIYPQTRRVDDHTHQLVKIACDDVNRETN